MYNGTGLQMITDRGLLSAQELTSTMTIVEELLKALHMALYTTSTIPIGTHGTLYHNHDPNRRTWNLIRQS